MLIKGIHHVSMNCSTDDEFEKAKDFYIGVLGLKVFREWNEGILLDTGSGIIEIFAGKENTGEVGAIRHFALLTEDVDELADSIRKAGYDVFIDPDDRVIPCDPPYRLRMAFCSGPLGEHIELFCPKGEGS